MSKKFQLQIPEPCHESWDKMTPVDKGRFCDSCQKAVIDFTGMSDAQLIAYFKKPSTGSICGRFYNDQLERDFELQRKRLPWLKYLFQFAIPVFLTAFKSYSQGKPIFKEHPASVCTDKSYKEEMVLGDTIPLRGNAILGKVIDENGKGIPYATVIIKGTRHGVSCDSAGNFYLGIQEKSRQIFLVASCVGYEAAELEVNTRSSQFPSIVLESEITTNNGVVVVSSVHTRKGMVTGAMWVIERSYLQRLKDYFLRESINIFPNPAKAGTEIKIEWKNAAIGDHNIDLYNLQGQLIRSVPTETGTKTAINFRLPLIATGAYVLRLTNKKSGKQYAEKIIIQ